MTERPGPPPAQALLERAGAATDALVAARRWGPERDAELERTFEQAVEDALSVPSLSERSLVLRRLARVVVPASLRPVARAAARQLDAVLAGVPWRRR